MLNETLKAIKQVFLENSSDKEIEWDNIFSRVGISSGFKTEKNINYKIIKNN